MISSVVHVRAQDDCTLSQANGYLLMSAVLRALAGGVLVGRMHAHAERKPFSIGPVVREGALMMSVKNGNLSLNKGDNLCFRIAFLHDADFWQFREEFCPGVLALGGTGLAVCGVDEPGLHPLSCALASELWKDEPPQDGVTIRALSPTGFKSSGRQNVLPAPEAVFGSLMAKWEAAFGNEFRQTVCSELNLSRVTVDSFSARSMVWQMKDRVLYRGFVGEVSYGFRQLKNEDEARALAWLARFSLYSGVGHKTTQGMGQVICL